MFDDKSSESVKAKDEPKVAEFRQANPGDNLIGEDGKTDRQREVEEAQKSAREKQQNQDRDNRRQGQEVGGEFTRDPNAKPLDPRNALGNEASRRPPVPGVDKEDGGSSDGPGGVKMGSAPDVMRHPLPNTNNPDSPNNPASTAARDRLAASSTPPLPEGARTTHETPMDGKSDAQRADEKR